MTTLYLASGSPRRQELLTQLGLSFERLVPGIEERRLPQESAGHYVARLAREKAQAGVALASRDLPVLGADTIVILNGEVLEKPRDAAHAAEMLRMLSGKTHQVMTAVALADKQLTLDCLVVTEVTFACFQNRILPAMWPAENLWTKQVHTVFKGWVAVSSGRLMAAITPWSAYRW